MSRIPKPPSITLIAKPEMYLPSKDINRYRVIRTDKNNGTRFDVQMRVGFWIFSKWIAIGPCNSKYEDECVAWIHAQTTPPIAKIVENKPEVKVVWESGHFTKESVVETKALT